MASMPRPKISLTEQLANDLRERIVAGEYKPGDKLPTEQKLAAEHGVSRTVVREAVAALRADGMIEARQGAGVFVLSREEAGSRPRLWDERAQTISSIIEILELRAAVEIEAAGLAAQRCSPAQEARIVETYHAMAKQLEEGVSTEQGDFEFHTAIALATNNRQFKEFLDFLGRQTIPRSRHRDKDESREAVLARETRLLGEHEAILRAICARDPDAARDAMRQHLRGSLQRYRELAMRVGA